MKSKLCSAVALKQSCAMPVCLLIESLSCSFSRVSLKEVVVDNKRTEYYFRDLSDLDDRVTSRFALPNLPLHCTMRIVCKSQITHVHSLACPLCLSLCVCVCVCVCVKQTSTHSGPHAPSLSVSLFLSDCLCFSVSLSLTHTYIHTPLCATHVMRKRCQPGTTTIYRCEKGFCS